MYRSTSPPNQEELEELLRKVRPDPSQRFYENINNQPWNSSRQPTLWNWLNQPRLVVVIALVMVMGLSLILAAPALDVLASRIAQFFTSADSETVDIELPLYNYTESEIYPLKSITEAERLTGFDIKTPSKLPNEFMFTGAVYNPLRQSVTLNYESGDGSILRISQRPAGLEYQSISVNAKVERVQIGKVIGEYVTGGWRVSQPKENSVEVTVTLQATWDPYANIHFLRWQEEDILFEILFSGSGPDSPLTLDKLDLIEIAENLK